MGFRASPRSIDVGGATGVYIFLVLATANLAVAFLFWRVTYEPAYTLLRYCANSVQQFQACVNSGVSRYAAAHPQGTRAMLESLLRASRVFTFDPRLFSQASHEAGMALSLRGVTFQDAFAWCGNVFKQGCEHGYVMEHIDTHFQYPTSADVLFKLCDQIKVISTSGYLNCLHGVGHELLVKTSKNLSTAVELCMTLQPVEQAYACGSGVFMEYTKGLNKTSGHSETRVGSRSLPCEEFTGEAKTVCYGSVGSYRQFEPDSEPFATTYMYCMSVGEPYRTACAYGAGERLLIAMSFHSAHALKLCDSMEEHVRTLCRRSVIGFTGSAKRATQL